MEAYSDAPPSHATEPTHEHGGPKIYAMVFGALIVLTVVTVGASYINWGSGFANVIIAMLIASVKASLVALFFMHLRWDKPVNAVIFCSTLFFLGLFLIGCYSDTISREVSEPTNMKSRNIPGGQTLYPDTANPPVLAPGGATNAPAIPGASPQGSHGGAAFGTNAPTPQVPAK
jgi:cytochrome c oxidase subunit IV